MPYEIKDTPYTFPFIEEVTLDQFIKLESCKTDLKKLELLMGGLYEINKKNNSLQFMTAFIGLLNGLQKEINDFLKNPNKLEYGGKLMIMATQIDPEIINKTERNFWQQRRLKVSLIAWGKSRLIVTKTIKTLLGTAVIVL